MEVIRFGREEDAMVPGLRDGRTFFFFLNFLRGRREEDERPRLPRNPRLLSGIIFFLFRFRVTFSMDRREIRRRQRGSDPISLESIDGGVFSGCVGERLLAE